MTDVSRSGRRENAAAAAAVVEKRWWLKKGREHQELTSKGQQVKLAALTLVIVEGFVHDAP